MNQIGNQKVGSIVAQNFRTAQVFTAFDIDFCCKGELNLAAACEIRGLDLDEVSTALSSVMDTLDGTGIQGLSMSQLINHILKVHHKFVEENIPAIKFYLEKIEGIHGDNHPELHEIKALFFQAADDLTVHMKKEEFILFPYIKAMEDSVNNNYPLSPPHFGVIENPISMMEHEHENEGDRFRRISFLSNHYSPPADACQTFKVAYSMLEEFERDLHTHIHLENNILFPKAVAVFNDLQN